MLKQAGIDSPCVRHSLVDQHFSSKKKVLGVSLNQALRKSQLSGKSTCQKNYTKQFIKVWVLIW